MRDAKAECPRLMYASATVLKASSGVTRPIPHVYTALKNIVVPTDGSALAEGILTHAVGLSKALGSRIQLIRVTPHDTADADERDHLLRISERLMSEGVGDVAVEILNGDPATEIVEYIDRTPNSLLAMTTHGHSGIGRWIIGSVADRVVRHAAGPVLVLRSSH